MACVHRVMVLFLGGMAVAFIGCGGPQERLVAVTGKVTVDGKALTTGTVSLRPDKGGGNTSASEPHAEIGADGAYTVFTGTYKGAPVGKFHVLVTAYEAIDPKKPSAAPKSLVDAKYADPSNPLLKIEVTENAREGQYDLELKK